LSLLLWQEVQALPREVLIDSNFNNLAGP
jgi:hypothetical protein